MKKEDFYVITKDCSIYLLDPLNLRLFKEHKKACEELRLEVNSMLCQLEWDPEFENLGWSDKNDAFYYRCKGTYHLIKVDKISVLIPEEKDETQRTS